MRRHSSFFSVGLLFLICAGLSSAGLAAENVCEAKAEPLAVAIWRLERAITQWQRRASLPPAVGFPTVEELEADAQRFGRQLKSLEGNLATKRGEADQVFSRKLANLAALLGATGISRRATTTGSRLLPTPSLHPLAETPRIVRAEVKCEDAVPIGEGTVAWQFPEPPGEGPFSPATGEAWFRFVSSRDGWLLSHTGGSRADTEIAVFRSCSTGQAPFAANDDALGLLSAVGFLAASESSWWIRIRQCAGLTAEPVLLTVGSAGGIEGTVTEEATGSAIADIRVEISERDTGWYVGSSYTSASGTYLMTGLAAGEYVARTDYSEDHLDELWDDRPCYDNCDVTTGDPIQVVEGQVTSGIDFALLRAGAISGRIRDAANSEALEDIRVEIVNDEGHWSGWDHTGAAGRFTVGGLAPGIYFASVRTDKYREEVYDNYPCLPDCQPIDGTPILVMAEEVVDGINFDLEQLGSIAGTLLDTTTGEPIASASLGFYDAAGNHAGYAGTDELGRYLGGGLEEGTYFVVTDLWGGYRNEVYDNHPCTGRYGGDCDLFGGVPVPVALHTTTDGIDFALDRLGGISGDVLDEATLQPIDGLEVRVWSATGDHRGSTTTGALGTYVVEDLYPEAYFATTDADSLYLDELYDNLPCPGGATDACNPTTGDPIAVTLESFTEGIDFELTLGGVVTGTLVDALTGTPLDGKNVNLWNESGAPVGHDRTDDTGSYWWSALPGGIYFLTTDSYGSHLDELFDDLPCPGGEPPGCNPASGSPVTVVQGETTSGIDFELLLRGGLAGSIVAFESGLPLPGVAVDVWDANGSHLAARASDATGIYEVDLSSGTYYVSTDNGQGYVDEIYDGLWCPDGPAILGLCDPLTGDAVLVIGAEPVVTGIDFALAERLVFADSFESGDTSTWSSTVP